MISQRLGVDRLQCREANIDKASQYAVELGVLSLLQLIWSPSVDMERSAHRTESQIYDD